MFSILSFFYVFLITIIHRILEARFEKYYNLISNPLLKEIEEITLFENIELLTYYYLPRIMIATPMAWLLSHHNGNIVAILFYLIFIFFTLYVIYKIIKGILNPNMILKKNSNGLFFYKKKILIPWEEIKSIEFKIKYPPSRGSISNLRERKIIIHLHKINSFIPEYKDLDNLRGLDNLERLNFLRDLRDLDFLTIAIPYPYLTFDITLLKESNSFLLNLFSDRLSSKNQEELKS